MSHVNQGTLLAIRDGSLVDAEARRHVEECPSCTEALAKSRTRAGEVARMLSALDDGPVTDLETSKEEVRRRLDRRRESRRPGISSLAHALGRAAILVLLASGVVYAVPDSPLRGWISDLRAPDPASGAAPAEATRPERIDVTVPAEGLRIAIVSSTPGQRIEVTLSDEPVASVTAPSGTRYSVSAEAARAVVTDGPVTVTLPRGSGPVTVELDGRTILRSSAAGVEVFGDVASRDGDTVLFSAGAG